MVSFVHNAASDILLDISISPQSIVHPFPPRCLLREARLCKTASLGFFPLWLLMHLANVGGGWGWITPARNQIMEKKEGKGISSLSSHPENTASWLCPQTYELERTWWEVLSSGYPCWVLVTAPSLSTFMRGVVWCPHHW